MPVTPLGSLQERAPQETHTVADWPGRPGIRTSGFPVQVIRNAVAGMCSSGQKRTPLWAVPSAGSDCATSAVLTVAAGLTDSQPSRVDWGDAGPRHGRTQRLWLLF